MKNKLNDDVRQNIPKWRIVFFAVLMTCAAVVFVGRLIFLQIANHDYYKERAIPENVRTVRLSTTRGEICDRNGERLVINDISNDVILNGILLSRENENAEFALFFKLAEKYGIEVEDILPISKNAPYILIDGEDKKLDKFISARGLEKKDISGSGLYDYLYSRYSLSELEGESANILRRVMGLRYALEVNDFSASNPYTLIKNADITTLSVISEQSYRLPGFEISPSGERSYVFSSFASHLLGRLGPIYPEEKDEYLKNGYTLDSLVGKDGAESAFESYLRGVDGEKRVTLNAEGTQIIAEETTVEPKPGLTVRLTIDAGLQKVAEQALYEAIRTAERDEERKIGDMHTGAIVVEDPKTGEILAKASYPTYDQTTYRETVGDMINDETRPLFDRTSYGVYSPGSIFKILTAVAALDSGTITTDTYITDLGVYKYFDTYQPHCWVYDKYGTTHGTINVQGAIEGSCNYFFFEVGKNLGIESLNEYANRYGFGVKTGIETGESAGVLASPEYSAEHGKVWNPGDVIQSAIGQLDNAFTPLQISAFMSTVINGGKRYKTHIFKSADSYYTGEVAYEYEPEVIEEVSLPQKYTDAVKEAMRQVVADGTASSVFLRCGYSVGGKTGTAQTSSGNNALFCGFAPFDDPEIVVTVVIENGYKSTTAAAASKKIFDYYYENMYSENGAEK